MPSVGERLRTVMRTPPMRFQVRGVRFLEQHGGRAILGDDMGLGKTFQAIGWMALHPSTRPVIVVCPATIKWNWQRELRIHAGLRSRVLMGYKRFGASFFDRKSHGPKCKWFPTLRRRLEFIKLNRKLGPFTKLDRPAPPPLPRVAIINYDILEDWIDVLEDARPQVLVLDECHNVKNSSALRTKLTKRLARITPHVIPLSGTPIRNRPSEFFPVLNMVAPDKFPSFWDYAFRYCKPRRKFMGRGWDFSGADHLDELHERVSDVMIRRTKEQVLKDLPRKPPRTVIPVDLDNQGEYDEACLDFLHWLRKRKGKKAADRASGAQALVKLGALKRLAAEGKLATMTRWIREQLEDTDEKLVIFAVHKLIVERLLKAFPKAAVVTGSVTGEARQKAVDRFQKDKRCRVFIGNLKAAGEGITLHASHTVVFAELGWTPGEHDQATDRVRRIGQTSSIVNAYYFIARGTVEEDVIDVIETKAGICSQVLDGEDITQADTVQAILKKWRRRDE